MGDRGDDPISDHEHDQDQGDATRDAATCSTASAPTSTRVVTIS
jgi:hypothetical protein